MNDKAEKIAKLNDELRTTFDLNKGRVLLTRGIAGLSQDDQSGIIDLVKNFGKFTKDNDPYGEHDFGKVTHNGNDVFWKIDYYDPSLQYHTEDATDPNKTIRVLTVMLANEY